jgi:hypothetical protein
MADGNIFLACPSYDGTAEFMGARCAWLSATKTRRLRTESYASSLLTRNCNTLWCDALNNRAKQQFKWFAMLHADIVPEDWWLDKLIDEAEKYDADLMSAVVPMKSHDGVTSTGISQPGRSETYFCRLTMQQIHHPDFPVSFGIGEAADALERLPPELRIENVPREFLFVNTGCMVCRIDKPWATEVWFENEDTIINVNGTWRAVGSSEDWIFSKRVAQQGGKVMATRIVNLIHRGVTSFSSAATWGHARDLGS